VVVVDTNVLASLLLAGPFTESARALHAADAEWRSEAFLMTEFANVLATQIRLRGLSLADALDLLGSAGAQSSKTT
jgi:predicted nucleic acid-binding protein